MSKPEKQGSGDNDLERMNKALKAAMETPPRTHAEEPKRDEKQKIEK